MQYLPLGHVRSYLLPASCVFMQNFCSISLVFFRPAKWNCGDQVFQLRVSSVSWYLVPSCQANPATLGHPAVGIGKPYVPLGQVRGMRTSGSVSPKSVEAFAYRYVIQFSLKVKYQSVLTSPWKIRTWDKIEKPVKGFFLSFFPNLLSTEGESDQNKKTSRSGTVRWNPKVWPLNENVLIYGIVCVNTVHGLFLTEKRQWKG